MTKSSFIVNNNKKIQFNAKKSNYKIHLRIKYKKNLLQIKQHSQKRIQMLSY